MDGMPGRPLHGPGFRKPLGASASDIVAPFAAREENGDVLRFLGFAPATLKPACVPVYDSSGIIAFGYDARGRLVQKTSTISSVAYPVTSAYGPGGRVASVTYPSGRVVTSTRDSQLGKIASVSATGFGNLVSGPTDRNQTGT
jgi:YD repeat-containing protein